GHNYLQEGLDLGQAQSFYEKALSIFQQIQNRSKQADVYYSLGDLFLKKGNTALAKEYYHKSMALAEALNHKELIKNNAGQLAYLYEKTADPAQALEYYKVSQIYK